MIKTHGLTHVAFLVSDPEVSLNFYATLFGVKEYFRDSTSIQVLGPGAYDVIVFEKTSSPQIRGSIDHIGFRLTDPNDIDKAVEDAKAVGAEILDRGEFGPGLPFVNILDPDGNRIEIWYE